MKIRTSILPKKFADVGATALLVVGAPLVYWYGMIIILPYNYDPASFWYQVHFLSASFIFFNILTSFLYIILCDTSIKGHMIPQVEGYKICSVCESITPPRSWHCPVCNICVLKRDHHCIFTSCCIGFYNHRYFLTMLLYLTIGAIYATYFSLFYMIDHVNFRSPWTIIRLLAPMLMLITNDHLAQLPLIVFILSLIGSVFGAILLYYHVNLVRRGTINHEKIHNISKFNLGFERNFRHVFGNRWQVAWISSIIPSELPGDGIHFDTCDTIKDK